MIDDPTVTGDVDTEPTDEDLADNLAAVLGGLVDAARRATVVRDQALDVARDAIQLLEDSGPGTAGRRPSVRVTALRGRLHEIAGRAATLTTLDEVGAALALLPPGGLGIDDAGPTTAPELAAVLARCRFAYRDEDQLQAGIAQALTAHGYEVQREVRLDARDRIDLLVDGDVVVEVKLAGTLDRLHAQLARYAAHDRVRELLVVTTRARHGALWHEVGGKPCRVLRLAGAR